jgi:hypothetical protein
MVHNPSSSGSPASAIPWLFKKLAITQTASQFLPVSVDPADAAASTATPSLDVLSTLGSTISWVLMLLLTLLPELGLPSVLCSCPAG